MARNPFSSRLIKTQTTRCLGWMAVVIFLGLSSCKRPSTEGNAVPPTEDEPPMEMMDAEGWDESLGVKVLKGKLTTTKGAQPMVEGVLLATEIFNEDHQQAMVLIQEFKGKVVEVKGEVIRHHCGPMEQCLSQGYIDVVRVAEYLNLK